MRSAKSRLAAGAPAQSVAALTSNDAAFALDLLHAVQADGNFFYSPHIHEAFVSVNEAGTGAAAAAAVISGKLAMPQTATHALTRPFVFLIRDKQTGAVVFLGHVVDPSAT